MVGLKYSFQSEKKLYLVLDYLAGGELFNHMRRCGMFTEDRARFYAAETLTVLEYLHEQNVLYRYF